MTNEPGGLLRALPRWCPFLLASVLWSCAGQIMPGGGPADTEPPAIIRTYPDSNDVRVRTSRLELEFSEYVDRRTVEESIFISPSVGRLEFDWSGTDVTVLFSDTLRRNTTYVVNIGTDVVDLRLNRLAHGYTLAFSTGDSIDQGMIRGRVFDERPEGVMIFAYQIDSLNADSLNPVRVHPDYIMQTGKSGEFVLSNIAFGAYRVIAVRDEFRNLLYDREIDQYGLMPGDVRLGPGHPVVSDVRFRMAKEDTTNPFLTGASAADRFHILARFSEPLDTLSVPRAVFRVVDTLTGKQISLGAITQRMINPALVGIESREPLDSTGVYRLSVRDVFDRSGNPLDSSHATLEFPGSAVPDTILPRPSVHGIADSSRGYECDMTFEIEFSRPVVLSAAMAGITLQDSTRSRVAATLTPRSAAELFLVPAQPLKPFAWYSIRVVLDSVRDNKARGITDSVWRVRFQTLDARILGSIGGRVVDAGGSGAVYVTATSVDQSPPRSHTVRMAGPGGFLLDRLPEGRYTLQSFRDQDGNAMYSPGVPFPFMPAERFGVFPDTVKVRARWGIEGLTISY